MLCFNFLYNSFGSKNEGLGQDLETNEISDKQKWLLKSYKASIFRFNSKEDSNNGVKVKIIQHQLNRVGIKGRDGQTLPENGVWCENTKVAFYEALRILESFDGESKLITGETKLETQKVKNDVTKKNEEQDKNLKTQEEFGKIEGTFWAEKSGEELKNLVNMKSLNKILNLPNTTLVDLYNKIISISDKNHKTKDGLFYNYSWYDIGDLKELLEKNGYESNGIFGGEEMGALIQIIEDVVNTQKKILSLNHKEKLKILLDSDINGFIDDDIHFYTKETELFELIKTENQFGNLLANLGYKGISDFNEHFGKNYFAARKEFKIRLGSVLNNSLNINPLDLINGKNAINKGVEKYNLILAEIENNKRFKNIKYKDKELADKIKFQGAAIILGAVNGGGISFDISQLTSKVIDSVQLGVIDGMLGINFNKKLLEEYKGILDLDVGLTNFIPYISISSKLYETKLQEFKNLFPNEIPKGTNVTLGAGVSLIGSGVGIEVSKVDENTKRGIEKMCNNMSLTLDKVFNLIDNGVSFDKSGLDQNQENQEIYTRIESMNSVYGKDGRMFLKEGLINDYKRELYKNAGGLHFVGGSIGITFGFDKWFGNSLLLVGAHFQHHSQKWLETQTKQVNKKVDKGFERGIELGDKSLVDGVNELDKYITYRTRTNKYSYEIMDPNLSIEERWQGFENFANRKGKFSKELSNTINSFKNVLNFAQKDGVNNEEKLYIISTITQFMKKSKDMYGGDLGKINSNFSKIIEIKNKRRKSYNTLLGFNTDQESKLFDDKLSEAGKANSIGETKITGISFDASSSKQVGLKRKAISGVDVYFSNLQVLAVNGEPILVPIKDLSKINSFIKKIETLNTLNQEFKNDLIDKLRSGEVEIAYYSDPDGFDDRIILINKSSSGNKISVYKPINVSRDFYIGYSAKKQSSDTKSGDKANSEPIYEDGEVDINTPGKEVTPNL